MSPATPLDFTLRLFEDAGSGLRLQLLNLPQGGNGQSNPPLEDCPAGERPLDAEMGADICCLAAAVSSLGQNRRAGKIMRRLGDRLRRMLFPPTMWQWFCDHLDWIQTNKGRLCLRILIEPEPLAAWPYEYLYVTEWESKTRSGFLALNRDCLSLVHLSRLPGQALPPAAVVGTVKILIVCCSGGVSTAHLPNLRAEVAAIRQALERLTGQNSRRAVVDVLPNPTPAKLKEEIGQGYHVLIYLGHADDKGGGRLQLDGPPRRPGYYEAGRLAEDLAAKDVRLVVLGACSTVRIAQALAARGLAVVAMHFPFPDVDGPLFSDAFWRAIVSLDPIPDCVAEAREALMIRCGEDDPGWGNLALVAPAPYDGVLFAPFWATAIEIIRERGAERYGAARAEDLSANPGRMRLPGKVGGQKAQLHQAMDKYTRLVIQTYPAELRARSVVRLVGRQPGPLPLLVRFSELERCDYNLAQYLLAHVAGLHLPKDFAAPLERHLREGHTAPVLVAPSSAPFPLCTFSRMVDLAHDFPHDRFLVVVEHRGDRDTLAFLEQEGFAWITLDGWFLRFFDQALARVSPDPQRLVGVAGSILPLFGFTPLDPLTGVRLALGLSAVSARLAAQLPAWGDRGDGRERLPLASQAGAADLAALHCWPVERLGFSAATHSRLADAGIRTVGDLTAKSPAGLLALLGANALDEVLACFRKAEFTAMTLSQRPVQALEFSPRTQTYLDRSGVRTVGDLLVRLAAEGYTLVHADEDAYYEVLGRLADLGLRLPGSSE